MNKYNLYLIGEGSLETGSVRLRYDSEIGYVSCFDGFNIDNCQDDIEAAVEDNVLNNFGRHASNFSIQSFDPSKHNKILANSLKCYKESFGKISPSKAIKITFGDNLSPTYLISVNIDDYNYHTLVYYVIVSHVCRSNKKVIKFNVFGNEYVMNRINDNNELYSVFLLDDESKLIVVRNNETFTFSILYKEEYEEDYHNLNEEYDDSINNVNELELFIENFLNDMELYIEYECQDI